MDYILPTFISYSNSIYLLNLVQIRYNAIVFFGATIAPFFIFKMRNYVSKQSPFSPTQTTN
ncbi:hypothetical protein MHA_0388 [Mannheimia haemolytica PHL213]|nr:hypothetical protein MHA_0388 [Mannheimia haemolytica PHL213]